MEIGRKRLRADIEDRNRQQKYLVTDKIVERSDKMMMEKVYGNFFSFLQFKELIIY